MLIGRRSPEFDGEYGARPEQDSVLATSANPLAERGTFTVACQRCRQTSRVGLLDLLIFQLPLGVWLALLAELAACFAVMAASTRVRAAWPASVPSPSILPVSAVLSELLSEVSVARA